MFISSHCGIHDPSWSELRHFVWFLNSQLLDCEQSVFCTLAPVRTGEMEFLPGFKLFVVRFMMQMSKVRELIILYLHSKSGNNNINVQLSGYTKT